MERALQALPDSSNASERPSFKKSRSRSASPNATPRRRKLAGTSNTPFNPVLIPPSPAPPVPDPVMLIQWNCRGFGNRQKRSHLLLFIQSRGSLPAVLALQEAGGPTTSILVHKSYTAVQVDLDLTLPHDYSMVTVLPSRRRDPPIHVLNVYCPPDLPRVTFSELFYRALNTAARDPLVIVGDFNAPSLHCGYHYDKARGRKLKELISTLGLTLFTDPALRKTWGTARLTDWPAFRTQPFLPLSSPDGYSARAAHALSTQRSHTRVIQTTQAAPAMDPHLLHLWDVLRGLLRRWRRHKLNRKLKACIDALTEEAAAYAAHLSDTNWVETCAKAAGQMGSRGTWRLFRSLLDPSSTRGETQRQLRRALHGFPGTSAQLADKLRDRYLCRTVDLVGPEYQYSGCPNPELDAPFTLPDLQAVLAKMRRGTAPGCDGITVTLLVNLPDSAYLNLPHLMNSKSALLSLSSLPPPRPSLPSGPIPVVPELRVLGLFISSSLNSGSTLTCLRRTGEQVSRMIRRVSTKRGGLRGRDALRLAQAFVISWIMYAAPYLRLGRHHEAQLDAVIRSVHKRALDLPVSTSNRPFAALEVHNSYSELREAHLVNQLGRLSQTSPGRRLLARLALQPILPPAPPDRIPDSWRQKLSALSLMLNSNGGAGAADGLRERALDSGVEQRLQIREWNTICAAGARRKRKFYPSGAKLPRIPCVLSFPSAVCSQYRRTDHLSFQRRSPAS
ncbi:hypothetical protein HPB49_014785 [Dermacentor silvarum]|uniref:Uncharacterized protein n=1 Tax=Dermacentor silvarum TaxID=543639 RepID=A0ACB8CFU3_DERSI|nr:hypothetical protein HPB49_014785 [Dermacentor silvarum]